jgi:hypothetical protein
MIDNYKKKEIPVAIKSIVKWIFPIYATCLTVFCIYAMIQLTISQWVPFIETLCIVGGIGGTVCGLLWLQTYSIFTGQYTLFTKP